MTNESLLTEKSISYISFFKTVTNSNIYNAFIFYNAILYFSMNSDCD